MCAPRIYITKGYVNWGSETRGAAVITPMHLEETRGTPSRRPQRGLPRRRRPSSGSERRAARASRRRAVSRLGRGQDRGGGWPGADLDRPALLQGHSNLLFWPARSDSVPSAARAPRHLPAMASVRLTGPRCRSSQTPTAPTDRRRRTRPLGCSPMAPAPGGRRPNDAVQLRASSPVRLQRLVRSPASLGGPYFQ